MKAPAFRSERMRRRAERVANGASTRAQPASAVFDPIDVQIASLLESVASDEAQAVAPTPVALRPEVRRAARVAPAKRPKAKAAKPAMTRPPRKLTPARKPRTRTIRRRDRFSVRETLAGIAIELPRPYVSYTVKATIAWMAVILFSLAVGLLIIYLMSP
jgi:hypothetical protein